jgi:hypothetical protein
MNDVSALIQRLLKYLTELSRINIRKNKNRDYLFDFLLVRRRFVRRSLFTDMITGTADSVFESNTKIIIC